MAAALRHQIGDALVTRIAEAEGYGLSPVMLFPDYDAAVFAEHAHWLAPRFWDEESDRIYSSFHSWLIQTPRLTILLDACAGNHKERPHNPRFHRLDTPFLARLAEGGIAPEAVDVVVCTHLHADHCGWNTRRAGNRWVPTFPRARHVFSAIECARADTRESPLPAGDVNAGAFEDSVLPILEAGLAELSEGVHQIADGITVEPAPGHTAGHIVLRLRSRGCEALFTGDAMHQPIQVVRPDWNSRFCEQPEIARLTRKQILEDVADRDVTLFPAHFGGSYRGKVRSTAAGFAFVPHRSR